MGIDVRRTGPLRKSALMLCSANCRASPAYHVEPLSNALRDVLGEDFEQENPALELSSTAAVRAAVLAS